MAHSPAPVCIMLDVDGVLVSGRPSDGAPWTHNLHADLGLDPAHLVRSFFAQDWQAVVTGQKDLRPSLAAALTRMGAQVSAQELISYWFEMESRIVTSVLEDCRVARRHGHSVYLCINQDHARAQYLMQDMGLEADVDGIVYSAAAGAQKPVAAFYAYAAQITGYAPQDMVLVDDTLANVTGARQVSWQAAHWDGSERLADILQGVAARD